MFATIRVLHFLIDPSPYKTQAEWLIESVNNVGMYQTTASN